MHQTFEFTKLVHGEQKKETVMMVYPQTVDIAQVMHTLGLAYCMNPEGTRRCPDELTFAQFMDRITPEMLERRSVRIDERIRLRRIREAAERFAGRLEWQRTNQHPVIFTRERASGKIEA